MPDVNALALTTLDRVKMQAGKTYTSDSDSLAIYLINEVSRKFEAACGRFFRSRTYTHNGTALPRLYTSGGRMLFLPNTPITAVSAVKRYPTETALVEGYDRDFVVHPREGIIELTGSEWYDAGRFAEITYVGGFLDSPIAGTETIYGWDDAGAEIRNAVTAQVCWALGQKERFKDGIASFSVEGHTYTYLTDPWLPEVAETIARHRSIACSM